MTDKPQCTSEFCPWDHDPTQCAQCIELGVLMDGKADPDVLADRLEQSQNLMEEQSVTDQQQKLIDAQAFAVRQELHKDKVKDDVEHMTLAERKAREIKILKEMGF
jgi:hypothetical protein